MSVLGPRARALIDATRNADDPTAAEAHRVRGSIEARIALGAGTVMASAAVVTTAGSAAAAPTAAVVATVAWVKIAAGVVVACAVATGAGVVAMSSSNGPAHTRATAPASLAPASPVASARVTTATTRGPSIAPLVEVASGPGVAKAALEIAPSAPISLAIASAAPLPSAVVLRSRPAFAASPVAATTPTTTAPPPAPVPLNAVAAADPIAPDSALDHEIALLSVARSSLREGNPSAALSVLHDAAQRFPNGPLAEDRAAETVFALCALGRGVEARAEAARLLTEHPRSPHAAAVRESCGGSNGSPNP